MTEEERKKIIEYYNQMKAKGEKNSGAAIDTAINFNCSVRKVYYAIKA